MQTRETALYTHSLNVADCIKLPICKGSKNEGGFSMKKSKLLAVALIALMLAGGLALASCGPKCSNEGKCKFTVGTPYNSSNDCSDKCIFTQGTDIEAADGDPRNLSCNCS